MNKCKLILALFLFLFLMPTIQAQDVAICGWDGSGGTSTAGDEFSFVLLRDHAAGEIIYFTEDEYSVASGNFLTGEGHLAYTVPVGGLLENDVVRILDNGNDIFLVQCAGGTAVKVAGTGNWSFSNVDEIYAYSASNPASPWSSITEVHCFIFASNIAPNADQIVSGDYPNSIYIGINLNGPGGVNADFKDPARVNTTIAMLQNPLNWDQVNITNTDITLDCTDFTNQMIASSCVDPDIPSLSSAPGIICDGNAALISIDGNIGGATNWSVYTGSCGGTLEGTSAGSTFIVTPVPPSTTYYVRGEGGCVVPGMCAEITITTTAREDASFSYAESSYCMQEADPTPSITGVLGGTFTSSPGGLSINSGTGTIDLSASSNNTYTITYESPGLCSGSENFVLEITDPLVSFTGLPDLCIDAGVQAGQGGGTPIGGVYSGAGVTDNGNGMSYSFDPSAAGVGVHTITYNYTDGNGCMGSASDDVEVNGLPSVTFTALADLCLDAGTQSNQGGGSPAGGTYSGPGVTDDNSANTYSFSPAAAGVGVHTITYSFTDNNGCSNSASDDVEVFALPTVTFTAPADLCVDAASVALSGSATPGGGTQIFSGPGVSGTTFVPLAAGLGIHTITFTYIDPNGCINAASDLVQVNSLPTVIFNIPAAQDTFCITDGIQTITGGLPTTGVYSGPGVTDDGNGTSFTFDPAAAGLGLHILTYTFVDANGCAGSDTDFISVQPLPTVTFTALPDLCINDGVQNGQGGGSPAGGVYSGTGVTDDGNGMTYSFDPAAATVGIHTLTYTYANSAGCTNSASDDVQVFSLPSVTFTAPADLCLDAGVQAGESGGVPAGGVYSGAGVTDDGNGMTYSFDPSAAGSGTHTITYSVGISGCAGSAMDDIEVFALPTVTFTALADLCVDAGVQAAQGGGSPTGGVYSGPGVIDDGNGMTYTFDPSAAGVGVHTIIYDYTDANGCSNSASDDVEVNGLPSVTFTALADLCLDAGTQFNQGGGSPAGGTYSGPGVTDDNTASAYSFSPSTAGAGVHTITYSYTDANGCMNSASDDVEVFTPPTLSMSSLEDHCINDGVQTGLGDATPTGGFYAGTGVTDDGNGMTFSFDPAAAGVGSHFISYYLNEECSSSITDNVTVFALPTANFTALADLCIDAGVQASQGGGTPIGGVYSGSGITDDGNGMTYSFDPSAAGVGVHMITYTYIENGCTGSASDNVEVFGLPTVTFTALADLCIDAGIQMNQEGGTPQINSSSSDTGIYSGLGVTDTGDASDIASYSFDPEVAGVGVHTITYTYTDGNGCSISASDDVEVFGLPMAVFTAPSDLCVDAGVQAGLAGATPTGGVYSGAGVTDDGNGTTYSFDPAAAGVGVHTITYEVGVEGCFDSAMDDIEVFDLPTVTFSALADLCIDSGVQASQAGGTPTGGVYSGPGVTDNGNGMDYDFDPAAAGVGVHTITYDYTDGNGCVNSATDAVEVFGLPTVTFTALSDQCIDAGIQSNQSGGSPIGGTYSGPGVVDDNSANTYSFNPTTAGVGVHTITYNYTDGNGCSNTATDDVEVFALPVVEFTAPADLCLDAGLQDGLSGGTPTDGVYSGPGVTDNGNGMDYDFDPAAAGVGVHTITYDYTDANGCMNSATDDVEVFDLPVVTFAALADLCIDGGVQAAQAGGTPTGGVYSGPGVTDNGNGMDYDFDPAAAGVGVHTITYDYTDANGCMNSASDDVEVFDLPVVTFAALADLCIDGGVQAAQAGGTPTGGVYSGPGVTDNGNGMDYDFDPAAAGVGVHTITYDYTDANGCMNSATDDVEVFDLPVVEFTAPADLCLDAGLQDGLSGGTPVGGVYSGPGVTDDNTANTYSFNPMTAGVGVHTITYDYTDANGCMNTASDDVEVFDLPTVSLSTAAGYCLDADIADIALVGGSPTGGVYSGAGVTDLGDGVSYNFDPMAVGVGTHTISYTLTDDNGCSNTATSDIEVYECGVDIADPCACLDNATIFDCNNNTGGDDGQFSELVTVTGAGGPLPIGQTWTVVGATGALDAFNVPAVGMQSAGVLIPSDGSVSLVYNNGSYEVPFVHVDDMGYTLMIEGPFGAGSPANVTLTISNICQYPDPVFDPAIPAMINAMDPVITLGAMDTNGGSEDAVTYTLDGNPTVEIDPSTLAMGTHTVTMTYDGTDDGNGGVSPDGGTTAASPGCIQEVTKDFEIIVCMLEVDCSNIADETLACRADLPPVDFSLPMVTDSCGDVTRSALTIIPGNSGCPEDTVFITRTYFLQDQAGNMEQCMQTFTVVSTMDPTFTFFPGDTTVLCGASTDPSATGEATGTQECDFPMGDAVVTFSDVITPGSCPQEETITRTWTLTDACGRPVAMDQVIMVVDTIAPTMVCQTATLELDENGMVTLTTADIDNGSNDNCGGDVTLSLSMEAFTCDNLGTNDVWLIGEDACGNIDSCMTVVTIEDNLAPTLTCPMDIVMDNDPGICGAIVTFDVIGADNCDFTITQTEGIPSGEEYPVGETMNTYMIEDAAGTTAECSFLVTVNDVEGPVIDCPGDIIINLDAGECEGSVTYNIPFMDNCGSIDGEMSQAFNEMLINDALDCLNNTSNHLRYFENTQFVPLEISQVNFGIFNSGTMETVTVNVYMIGPGMAFEYGNMVLLGTTDQMIPAGTNNTLISAAVEATIPVGMNYVLELKANNTTNFVIGYNDAGESGSTYISGNDPVPCVSLEPVDVDVFGFGAFAVVLSSDAEAGPSIEQTAGLPQGGLFPIGTTTQTYVATDIFGNTTECTFDVIVNEFADVTGTMACNNSINVSLDLNCEVILNPDMLLEGGAYGCYDDYLINVSGGVGSGIITDPGTYTVTITDPDTGNSCWSTINVESKSEPVIDCTSVLCPIEMIEGEWTVSDATFSPGASWAFDGGAPNDDILYDVIKFVVETPGVYNLTMTNSEEFDGIAGLYVDSFDPLMPAMNLVGGDDDIAGVIESEPDFMIDLAAGTYYLVSSTWGAGQMGVYGWSFAGPGDILSDCNVKCYELAALLSGELEVPSPEVTSCTEYELYYTDAVNDSDCGITTVTRTYLAENQNGSSSCEVVFEIEPISIDLDVDLPNNPVEMSCNAGTDPADIVAFFDNPLTKDNPNTSIIENNEGYAYAYPTYQVNGHPQKIDNQACNAYAGYTDQELAACGEGCNGNRKVIRTWTLVDWCTLETQTYIQTIKAVDTEAPTLNTADITVGTDAWGCEATFDVPAPWELHDNCDSNPGYTVSGPAGVTIEGSFETGYLVSGLGKGIHTFVYTAYDCCGNEANYPFTVTAIDNTPPVVVAKQNVVVSLTSAATGEDGYAKLFAESINNGSYDGCGDVHLEIRRDGAVGQNDCGVLGNNSFNDDNHPQDGSSNPNSPNYDPDGGAYVKFCCEDISASVIDVDGDGTNDIGYHKVWLRVWDDGDMDGVYGTSGDQYNEAWAYVKVEDKLPPAIVCPPDVTLTCDMDYTDLDVTGRASGYASCGGLEVEWNDIVNTLNTCNDMGFIRRRWNIVGRTDIFCDQRIDMTPLAGSEPVVRFTPQLNDKEVTGCPEDIELSENERPTWVAGPCDVLGYTVEADTFLFEDGACLKIVREWTVINWCDYDPNDNPNEGIWRHTQVVKVTDDTQPTIESCDDLMFEVNDHSDSDGDGNVCEAKITLTNIANDPGSANCPTGWLKWQVFVDLWGDGTYDYEYSSFLPTNDTNVNAPNDTNGNGIIDFYVMPTESGGTISINLADIEGSMSNHKVDWKVTDGCNNVMTCSQNFMVVDKKAPTPYCIDISSAVMESSGTVELWAIDFNVGSFDNCTAQEALRYTFTEVAPEEDANYDATQRSSAMVFDCEDVENSPVEVNMYVWDEKGNADFCVVYLTLVDNSGACGDGMRVAGEVATESGVGVESVEVQLNAGLPEYPRVAMTDENGSYVFENSPVNVDYTVTASKDIDYLNGVSTLDLVKIQRHILGLESLDSPYKLIAADINADDAIKANDLSQLRKLILGVITDLPTNESWRFVDGGQEMDMDLDLGDVDYTTEITNLQSDMMNNDLVAVKVGDVTENATVNLTSENIEVRSNKTLELEIDNKSVKTGDVVEVTFRSEDFREVYGYQFTLELNGLVISDVLSGAIEMRERNVGILSDRVVTVSYHNGTAKSASREEGLFTMLFTATKDGQLSEMIEMTSKVTPSEAYIGESLEIREVVISTRGEIVGTAENNLYQNEPNPFKEQTTIGFELAEAGSVTMKVTDVAGKVLKVINTEGVRGMNYMTLEAEDFGVSGVLYYTIESGEFTDTKKMILVR